MKNLRNQNSAVKNLAAKLVKRKYFVLLGIVILMGGFAMAAALSSIGSITGSISITTTAAPNTSITGVTLGGLTCTGSGGTWSCPTPSMGESSSISLVISVSNTGTAQDKLYTSTACGINPASPTIGGCASALTVTDQYTSGSPLTLAATSTGTMSVSFQSGNMLTQNTGVGITVNLQEV